MKQSTLARCFLILLLGSSGGTISMRAQTSENGTKAAYLYSIAKYVEWPVSAFKSPSAPFVFGVVGTDSMGGELEATLNGKDVGGRKCVVRRLRWTDDLSGCAVLFVPGCAKVGCSELAKLKKRPVLIIGESPGFAKRGGIINFVRDSNHIRFEINAEAAKEAGLTISSKLLALGRAPE